MNIKIGKASFKDSSLNNLPITVNGNAQISKAQSKFGGSSAYFNGSEIYLSQETMDYLSIPNNLATRLGTDPFTIEAWVYSTKSLQANSMGTIITQAVVDEGVGNNTGWFLSVYQGNVLFRPADGGDFITTSLSNPIINRWAHVALVGNGSSIKLYVDGILEGQYNSSVNMNLALDVRPDTPTLIGAYETGILNQGSFRGYIDELRITKGVALYTSNFTPPTSELTASSQTSLLLNMNMNTGSITVSKGGSGKTNQKKYIDLLPPNFISKVTLSGGTYSNGTYTRNSGGTTTFNGPDGKTIFWSGILWLSLDPLYNSGEDATYYSYDLITWIEQDIPNPPTAVVENALCFLFDPIFYKNEIQNERYKISVQGCSLSYVNGIYSQTVNPSLVNNRPYFSKDNGGDMIIFDRDGAWVIRDEQERDYTDLFIKSNNCSSAVNCYPDYVNWSTPDGGDALGNETPPTIRPYLDLTEGRADLDPVFLEELRSYQLDGIIPTFPNIDVRQHIPGAPFNSRKAELRNNVYRYIKYNNNNDVEHLKTYGKIIYNTLTSGAALPPRNKNLQDLIQPLLKLTKNDSSILLNSSLNFTLNMFVKLQRPVSHTAPSGYLVREKRGIFFTSYDGTGSKNYPIILGYRSPYYNINGDNTYKLKFEPFSFVFSFGQGWTSHFGHGNFTLMTDYKYKFGEMYMLSISKQDGEYKIYINGELQTTALVPFNPCVLPTSNSSRSRRRHNARIQMTPFAPGFLQKNGSTYPYTSTSWTPENVGRTHTYLCFGKSRRSNASGLGGAAHHHRRKRYLNNLDIGVINVYNIALSQNQILEIYNNFRYRYL